MSWQPRSVRLKNVATYINRGVAPTYVDESTGFMAFSQKCTRPDRTIDQTLGRPMLDPGPAARASILREGDLVVNSTGTGTLGRVGLITQHHVSNAALVADGHVTIVRIDRAVAEPRFVWYQLSTDAFYELANATLAVGSTNQTELGRSSLGGASLLLPPIDEQRRIVEVLDAETARIDELIAEQERIHGLVEQRFKATITEVTTSGVGSGRPVRPSGVDWIGEVPSGWEVMRLKHLGTASIGLTYDPSEVVSDPSEGTLVLRASNVQDGTVISADDVYVTTAIPDRLRLVAGDILICSRNGSARLIGKNALIGRDFAGVTWGAFMTVFRSSVNPYLSWVFRSALFSEQLGLFSTSTINQLTTTTLLNFHVPVPPPGEQAEICEHLAEVARRYEGLMKEARGSIRLLTEHRQALITAAVTGGLDALRKVA